MAARADRNEPPADEAGWFGPGEPGCPDCGCKDVRLGRVLPYWNRSALSCVCRHCGKRFTIVRESNGCPVCGSGATKVTHTESGVRRCRCSACGLRFKLLDAP